MSRFLSPCSQRNACGRLARAIQWLWDGSMDDRVFGNEEVGLGKVVGKAGRVGCFIGDKKRTFHELARFTELSETETEESRKVKGRALLCGALFAQEDKEVMADLVKCFENDIQLGTTTLLGTHLVQHVEVSPIVTLFQQSSDMNDVYGMAFLCCCLMKGDGAPRDKKNALLLFERAADNGGALPLFQLGLCDDDDIPFAQNKVKQFELIQQAAEMSDIDAIVELGHRYVTGQEIETDYKKATELFRQAADMGNTGAIVKLGECYKNGRIIPQDKKKAIQLFRQATDMGNTNAMVQLGDCYMEGDGILRDKKKAIELYQQAADIGNVDAMSKLFNHYMVRGSVPRNKKKAIDSFQCAIDKGNTDAMVELGELFTKGGPGVPLDKKKAIELFQRAASLGNKCAILRIGRCYEEGYLVRPDIGKAIEWYQKAAKMG